MSSYQGYDGKTGPMFEWCCPNMQNNYKKAIRYLEDKDKFAIAWRPNENLQLEYLTWINNCPYCGAATKESNIKKDDRVASPKKK